MSDGRVRQDSGKKARSKSTGGGLSLEHFTLFSAVLSSFFYRGEGETGPRTARGAHASRRCHAHRGTRGGGRGALRSPVRASGTHPSRPLPSKEPTGYPHLLSSHRAAPETKNSSAGANPSRVASFEREQSRRALRFQEARRRGGEVGVPGVG